VKKTISILAYNRPDYLRQTVEALSRCRGIEQFDAVISLDGGSPIKLDVGDDQRTKVLYQLNNFGIDRHNEQVFKYVFNDLGSDVNVCLEDDVCLDPDALELVDWFAALPTRSHYAWLSIGNFDKRWECVGDPYAVVREEQEYKLCTAAFVLSKESWQKVGPRWCEATKLMQGWDWQLSMVAYLEKWKSLTPVVSRCTNIGRVGVHSYSEFFDEHVAGALHSDGRHTPDFLVERRDFGPIPEWVRAELAARVRR
jgi:hypothetical protein